MKPSFFKRFLVAIILGCFAAAITVYYLSFQIMPDVWESDLMWVIIANRITLAFVVAIGGVYMRHPIFGFKCPAFLRGAVFGFLISIELAIGAFIDPLSGMDAVAKSIEASSELSLFLQTLILGAVFGSVIDIIATAIGGQGKDLLKEE
ncbi:hypothetical protein AUK10_00020 [Candidatus Gracilibacteria bacterium CG2_30_37_12]|nr:MAG: hypothetical protein AUK10_00020 [Candidatus Gracilibacteria bacterium CG2_30_37_12]